MERIAVPLNYAWRTTKQMSLVQVGKGYRNVFNRIQNQVVSAKNERWVNEILYYAIKEIGQDTENLTEAQRRLVDLYLLEGRLNGIEIQGGFDKKRFSQTLRRLHDERFRFRTRVKLSQDMFNHRTEDFSIVQNLPLDIIATIAADRNNPARGPWNITLQHNVVTAVLGYCDNRTMRWNVWQAYNSRGSALFAEEYLTNHKSIDELRMYRMDLAHLLGYKNFAEMSMETKMAGNVENVLNMIETFKGSFKEVAREEMKELQEFASANGLNDKLQMWDVSYWGKKHRSYLYKVDEIYQYFTLEKVMSQLFNLCTQLFGITFKEATDEVETWHNDVRYFEVYDQAGENISAFFFDPFSRSSEKYGGSWMEMGREGSELMQTMPFSYLIMNLSPPLLKDGPVLMSFWDVSVLFHQFGHGLQQMLTQVPYSELSGQRNVELDAVQVCGNFMQQWLTVPSVVENISGHYQTGEPLSLDAINRLLQAEKHLCGYEMMRQLYFSAYDMEMYISKGHWNTVMTNTWEEFIPLPYNDHDHHPCCFNQIFSHDHAAAYYSFIWAEMIAADLFTAFEEVGLDQSDKLASVGRRFRDTFLSLGGSVPASEVFRRFRGRDPSLDALQKYFGVK